MLHALNCHGKKLMIPDYVADFLHTNRLFRLTEKENLKNKTRDE